MDERNWFRRLDHSWICDRMNGGIDCCIPHLIIDFEKGLIKISTWYSGRTIKTEFFRSKEEIDGFIEALKEEQEGWEIGEGNNKFKIGR